MEGQGLCILPLYALANFDLILVLAGFQHLLGCGAMLSL